MLIQRGIWKHLRSTRKLFSWYLGNANVWVVILMMLQLCNHRYGIWQAFFFLKSEVNISCRSVNFTDTCRKCVVNFPHYRCLFEFITHWTDKQAGRNLTFGKIHCIVPCLTWQHDIHKKYQRTLWLKEAAWRNPVVLLLPCLFCNRC